MVTEGGLFQVQTDLQCSVNPPHCFSTQLAQNGPKALLIYRS